MSLCVVIAATGPAACSSGGAQPSDFCKSVAALDSAVSTINENPVTRSTVPAVKTSLNQIDAATKNLSETAESQFASEVDAVKAGAADLDKTVAAAIERQSPANVNAVRVSMRAFTTSVDDLSKSTSSTC
jgi:methyl-accepting chemotaxis protein